MSAKLICTLLCDDVREEKGGKLILVGVYNSLIGFPVPRSSQGVQPKVAISQLCVFNRWELEPRVQQKSVTEILDPREVPKAKIENVLLPSVEGGYSQEILKFFGMVFDVFDGSYIIRTTCGNQRYETRFAVRIVNPATIQ